MTRSNDDVAHVLTEFADLLAIVADDPFKPGAYEKAARAVGGFPDELRDLDDAGIRAIPNVGKSIAEKVRSVLDTGTFPELEELRGQVPSGVRAMTAIPGFGPKKAMVVYRELAIDGLEELVAADGRDGRRRRSVGRKRVTGSDHGCLHGVRRRGTDPRAGRDEVLGRDPLRPPGGSSGDPQRGVGRGDDLFHRVEGA